MKMNNRLEYRKEYFLRVNLDRMKILEKGVYLGINLNVSPPRHVILSIPVLQITEFTKYKLSKRFLTGKKNMITLDPIEFDDLLDRDESRIRLNNLERDFAQKMYLEEAEKPSIK